MTNECCAVRIGVLIAIALFAPIKIASAKPHSGPACIQTGDLMRPCAYQPDFLAGVKSVKARMHRVARSERPQRVAEAGRPAGCPHAWCGCWLLAHLGMSDKSLWVARNWAHVGSPIAGPKAGAIVVWRHHVGIVQAAEGDRILVLSGNDGRRVRERWRSTRGVIAYRITE